MHKLKLFERVQVADKEQELAAASEREATEETGMAAKRAELDAQMREYERELGDQSSSLTKVQVNSPHACADCVWLLQSPKKLGPEIMNCTQALL